jgi:hypothetical protein
MAKKIGGCSSERSNPRQKSPGVFILGRAVIHGAIGRRSYQVAQHRILARVVFAAGSSTNIASVVGEYLDDGVT